MAYVWEAQVRFEAEGGAPERFVTAAMAAGIPLWNTARGDTILTGYCHARRYAALRPIARRHGMRLRVKQRLGLPFRLRRLRKGLVVGSMLFCLLLWQLSGGIWVIRVEGNRTVSDAEILQVLEPLGVRIGGRFSAVDIPTLQLTALQRLPKLGWLTVNQSGSVLTVMVNEKAPTVPVEETDPANVVAARDGVIVSLTVTGGQAVVKVGDAVTKGSLLISGVTDSPVGPLLRRAGGKVVARTTVTLTATVPFTESVTVQREALRQRSLTVFGWQIPLYTDGAVKPSYTPHTHTHPVTVGEMPLPLGWQETVYTVPHTVTVTRTAEEASRLAAAALERQEHTALQDATVLSSAVTSETGEEGVTVTGTYVCLLEIGRTEKIT